MHQPELLSLALGLALGVIHFLGEGFRIPEGSKHYRIISFAAGISIGYLFLDLLPHTYEAAEHLKSSVFLFLLLGFATVHLVEKYFYQHGHNTDLYHNFKRIHSITFFTYYFLVGCVLVGLIQESTLEGLLFVLPVMFHAGLSSASLSEIHGHFLPNNREKLLLSLAAPLGVMLTFIFPLPLTIQHITISTISGILLYVFVKEFLPEREKGQPLFFILGLILFYLSLILIRRLFH
jgi:hypothetical protein